MITKFRTAGSLGLVLGAALVLGCTSIPMTVEKTKPDDAVILQSKNVRAPKRVIFLSAKEAECPTRCAATVTKESYSKAVTRIEQRLQEQGYSLISGAIVSRIENQLGKSKTREVWDRTEKALLLGKETGADAIFEVRTLYIDQKSRDFLKEFRTKEFREKPRGTVQKAITEWRRGQKPGNIWLFIPIFGWAYYYVYNDPPSSYELPVWEANVSARMIDLDANVIWSGSKTVRSTDIMPHDWRASLDAGYPRSQVVMTFNGTKDQNFDYLELHDDHQLQKKQLYMIIDSLIAQLPKPS